MSLPTKMLPQLWQWTKRGGVASIVARLLVIAILRRNAHGTRRIE